MSQICSLVAMKGLSIGAQAEEMDSAHPELEICNLQRKLPKTGNVLSHWICNFSWKEIKKE